MGPLEKVIKAILKTFTFALRKINTEIAVFPFFSKIAIARLSPQRHGELCHTSLLGRRQEAAWKRGGGRQEENGLWRENGL